MQKKQNNLFLLFSLPLLSLKKKMEYDPNAPLCFCDKRACVITVKKNGPNFGKQFYSCPMADRAHQCRFFKPKDNTNWVDTRAAHAGPAAVQGTDQKN
jgi:hypothetical protein